MRGALSAMSVLAAGALLLGTCAAFAAQSVATTTTAGEPAAAKASMGNAPSAKPQETKESTAQERGEEREQGVDRILRGVVTHVETAVTPPTLTLNLGTGKQAETGGVEVPATTKITEGKSTVALTDITSGDRVWMRYDRTRDRLVADQIRILGVGKAAKAKMGQRHSTSKATPVAAKQETATTAAAKTGASK